MSLASICMPCSCMRSATWDLSSNTRSGFCCRMSMIWLEERLNDGVKLPALEELLESAYLSLPAVGVVTPVLSALDVGCAVFCAGKGESSVCPFAVIPPAEKNVNTDAATKTAICDTRAPRAPSREGRLGVTLTASATVEN